MYSAGLCFFVVVTYCSSGFGAERLSEWLLPTSLPCREFVHRPPLYPTTSTADACVLEEQWLTRRHPSRLVRECPRLDSVSESRSC